MCFVLAVCCQNKKSGSGNGITCFVYAVVHHRGEGVHSGVCMCVCVVER
jgi:hypothetical protein